MQITAAEREFKRAQDAWDIHVIPERDYQRARDDLETAKLNYAHAVETGGPGEGQPANWSCAASARSAMPRRCWWHACANASTR